MSTTAVARWTHIAFVAPAIALACARPAPPPGGEPDRTPPEVLTITPEPMSVVEGWDDDVTIRFAERLSERGTENALLVSPATGRAKLDRASWGSELRVSIEGGWRPGRIYRVVLRPGLQDRFGNVREEPIEMAFSTGPPIPASAVAGVVTDRMTGEPVDGARVEARTDADTIPIVALADSAGRFVLPHMPPERYRILAYGDGNRTARPEPFEARDSAEAPIDADGDTARVSLALLAPDTTPARLARAEPIDSTHVRLVFDDAFDPERPLDGASATLRRLPDSTTVPVEALLHTHVFEARRAERAAADSTAAADTTGATPSDTTGAAVAEDERRAVRAPPLRGTPADAGPAADSAASDTARSAPLPKRELVLVVATALEPGTSFRVEVAGLTNISGVPGGTGSAQFDAPEPPPEPADTTDAPVDTTATGDAPPDTTASTPPDTTATARPDTTSATAAQRAVLVEPALRTAARRRRRGTVR